MDEAFKDADWGEAEARRRGEELLSCTACIPQAVFQAESLQAQLLGALSADLICGCVKEAAVEGRDHG